MNIRLDFDFEVCICKSDFVEKMNHATRFFDWLALAITRRPALWLGASLALGCAMLLGLLRFELEQDLVGGARSVGRAGARALSR